MSSVYLLTLSQLSGRWRLLVMSVLALMPIVLTESLVLVPSGASVDEFELIVLNTMLAGSITPLVVLAIATVAFGNEVEDRTLANLTLAPIPRLERIPKQTLFGWWTNLTSCFETIKFDATPFEQEVQAA